MNDTNNFLVRECFYLLVYIKVRVIQSSLLCTCVCIAYFCTTFVLKVYFLSATQTKDIGLVALKWLSFLLVCHLQGCEFCLRGRSWFRCGANDFPFPFQARSLRGLHFTITST